MSHRHGRALKDKQNALQVFCKHFKSTETKTSNRSTPHCCSASQTKNTEMLNSQTNKIKRLKSRKERSLAKGGGSSCKTHCQNQHGNKKEHCHGCCQSSCQPSLRRGAPFAQIFTAGHDPSIITDNRLIGHHGLFNHEVKSIDIDRLLSEKGKLEKLGHCGVPCKMTTSHSPCPPAPVPLSTSRPGVDLGEVAVPDNIKEASDKDKAKTSRKKSHKSDEFRPNSESRSFKCSRRDRENVGIKKTFIAGYLNSQESGIPPGLTQTQQSLMSSSESDVLSLFSTGSPCVARTKSRGSTSGVPNTDRESQLSPSGKITSENPPDPGVEVQNTVLTLNRTPQNHQPTPPSKQPQGPSPNMVNISSPAREGGNTANKTLPNHVSAVARRLCQSLQLPLLHRRRLVEETREVLLQVLQERHGPQLQEKLLNVQRRLSFSTAPNTTWTGQGRSMTPDAVYADGAPLDDWFRESMVKQVFRKSAPHKRRRKELRPNRLIPPPFLSGPECILDAAPTQNSIPSVAQVEEIIRGVVRAPSSSHFRMSFEPTSSSSPNHIFAPASASGWAVQSSPPQPSDDQEFNMRVMRDSDRLEHFENWRYDSDFSFLNQTETGMERSSWPLCQGTNRQPFLQHPTGPPQKNGYRNLPQQQDSYDFEMSYSGAFSFLPASTHYPLDSHQLQPFSHFPLPPNSPKSHPPNIAYYPPSHMLESVRSPLASGLLPAFPSPECWSFPRMRLY